MRLRNKLHRGRPTDGVGRDAKVLSIKLTRMGAHQTGRRDQPHDIRLSISVPEDEPYEVVISCDVPWNRRPLVGRKVPVIVSAEDPLKARIDWDRMPDLVEQALVAAEAAQRGDASATASALGFHAVSARAQPVSDSK
jgi:hypothetical protein